MSEPCSIERMQEIIKDMSNQRLSSYYDGFIIGLSHACCILNAYKLAEMKTVSIDDMIGLIDNSIKRVREYQIKEEGDK